MDTALADWLTSSIGGYAQSYAHGGIKVFPCHGVREDSSCTCGNKECKNIGKHPFTPHGLNDASDIIEQIAALFKYRADLNIAIRTGEVSKLFVLDIDQRKGGIESLAKMIKIYGDLPSTLGSETGNGYHIYFSHPGFKVSNRTDFLGKDFPGLDIRGDGGYVIAPPSKHANGKIYKFPENAPNKTAPASAAMLELLIKKEAPRPLSSDHSTGATSEWSKEEVQSMLDALAPDMGYDDWLHIGMALHSGGFSLSMWDSWSRGGTKYENGDCEGRWHGFSKDHGITMGTLVDMAQLQGWKPTPRAREAIDTSSVENLVKKAKEKLKAEKPVKKLAKTSILGFTPMDLPGLIGDTVRWITKYAMRKQPELALMNTIAFAGSVFGRRYMSPLNTRTNIYTVGVAETAAGKDHSRKLIKDLAHACGLDPRIGADDIRSDSGMLRGLMNNASQVMMLDEFGHFLEGLANEKSPHYIRNQAKILLKLYSSSSSVYNHGDYADVKAQSIVIQYPNLCIYGTTTEDRYSKSLKKSAIESGELNRFITIRARMDKEYPDRKMPVYAMDEVVKSGWEQFTPRAGDSLGLLMNNSDAAPDPILIPWGVCDDIQYNIQCKQIDRIDDGGPYRHLWGRLFENTVKIAMIFAIARNKDKPEFQAADFDIAQMIVESSIEYLTHLASHHMSETLQEESNHEVLNAIIASDGRMGRKDIMRKFRKLKKRDLDEVISGLLEQETIEVEKITEGGRPKVFYKIIKEEMAA